jgi:Protein of unknown function (DUF2794)
MVTSFGATGVSEVERSESEAGAAVIALKPPVSSKVSFDRAELRSILNLYGRKDMAVFSIFRRSSEMPLYRIVKNPALARKQGAYSVTTTGGLILKRGTDLERVLQVLDKPLKLVR